jgi:hypothetical protein
MRGIVPGRSLVQRSRLPRLREVVRSGQGTLRAFLAEAAASVRRVYSGPVSCSALPFERVDWDHFDVAGVNYYRQQAPTTGQYLTKISELQATGKPVAITELGFASCRDADDPKFLSTFNATRLSMLGMAIPVLRPFIRPRVRTVYPRDEQAQARLLIDQLQLLDRAGVDRAFIMSLSFPLASYCEDPSHDLDATGLSIVRALPPGQHGTTYPDVGWEPKEALPCRCALLPSARGRMSTSSPPPTLPTPSRRPPGRRRRTPSCLYVGYLNVRFCRGLPQRASRGMRTWASGVPQPVTGSQPGPVW